MLVRFWDGRVIRAFTRIHHGFLFEKVARICSTLHTYYKGQGRTLKQGGLVPARKRSGTTILARRRCRPAASLNMLCMGLPRQGEC